MKIIILFSSYVAIINSMVFRETRRTYRPHHNEILEFVQSTSLVKAFNDLLNSSNEFQKINQDSFLRKTTHGGIDLSEHFANTRLYEHTTKIILQISTGEVKPKYRIKENDYRYSTRQRSRFSRHLVSHAITLSKLCRISFPRDVVL